MLALTFMVSIAGSAFAAGPTINLPTTQVTINVTFSYPDWWGNFHMTPINIPAGYDVQNGEYDTHCVAEPTNIYAGQYQATLFSSYDPLQPYRGGDPGWSKVNYILNHKQGDAQDVQEAIWKFINGGHDPTHSPYGMAMVNDANANGGTFVPLPGEIMAVIVWIGSTVQTCLLEVLVPPLNVVPEYPVGPILASLTFVGVLGLFKYRHSIPSVFKFKRI